MSKIIWEGWKTFDNKCSKVNQPISKQVLYRWKNQEVLCGNTRLDCIPKLKQISSVIPEKNMTKKLFGYERKDGRMMKWNSVSPSPSPSKWATEDTVLFTYSEIESFWGSIFNPVLRDDAFSTSPNTKLPLLSISSGHWYLFISYEILCS